MNLHECMKCNVNINSGSTIYRAFDNTYCSNQCLKKVCQDKNIYDLKYITSAKKENLASERQLLKIFPKNLVKKLIKDIAPRYKERKGGYTRIINLGERKSDKTKMVILELLKETSYAKKYRT